MSVSGVEGFKLALRRERFAVSVADEEHGDEGQGDKDRGRPDHSIEKAYKEAWKKARENKEQK